MVSKTFSILFYFKTTKTDATGRVPIYMRITVDGQRVELSTKRDWSTNRWSAVAGRATGTKEDAKELNAYLDTLQVKVHEMHRSLINEGQQVSASKIKEKLLGVSEHPKMILEIFAEHNKQIEQLVGNGYAPLTLKRYKTALRHAKEFINCKYRLKDFEISKLNYEFIREYEFYLKSVRKCGHNSTIKYLRNLKKVVLLCVKKGWLDKDPFYGFKLANKEVVRDFLTQQELDALTRKEFAATRLTIVRDIFLFSCYTGLAYVDVRKLKRSEIGIGMDGEKWVFTSRQKTEVRSRIPLLPVCLQIIKRYEQHPQCINRDSVLPVWSNQKMNEYLKEIADVSGINKRLTYHIARHTFATTVTLNNGVPIETVARMLGHKSLRTTQHYAKILDKKVSEDMQMLKAKLRSKTLL
jgi:site-specific recombinase XerD